MDSQEIATGILSLTAPGVVRWVQCERREMARRVNEYTGDLVARRPDRFGNLATVPLPDVDGALSELEYALDTLRADGVILLGNYAEKYLGDAAFEPCGQNSTAAKPSFSCIPGCHSLRRLASPAHSSITHSIRPERPSSSC
jgi:predicted TIM-barrel fold metal-dependent hydrolase